MQIIITERHGLVLGLFPINKCLYHSRGTDCPDVSLFMILLNPLQDNVAHSHKIGRSRFI
jgi:hypothetical protein